MAAAATTTAVAAAAVEVVVEVEVDHELSSELRHLQQTASNMHGCSTDAHSPGPGTQVVVTVWWCRSSSWSSCW